MNNARKIFQVVNNSMRRSIINPRFFVALLLFYSLVQQLIIPIRGFSMAVGIKSAPWIFPFLVSKYYIQMIVILGLVLLFCDAPFMNESTPYLVIRSGRRNWFVGQIVYIIAMSFVYYLCLVFITIALLFPYVQFQAGWGKILGTLAQTDAASKINTEPLSYALQVAYTPFVAMLKSFAISWLVGIFVACLMLFFNLWGKRISGPIAGIIVAFSPYFVLNFSALGVLTYVSPPSWMNIMFSEGAALGIRPSTTYIIIFCLGGTLLLSVVSYYIFRRRPIEVQESI